MDERWPFFTIDLELTNICHQGCLFCPREKLTRPPGFIDGVLFARIARKMAEMGSRVTFCGMGNPLLHPELETFGKLFRELSLNYGLTIQAPALNADGLQKIALLKPAFIEVSLPTIDPELFARLYPGNSLETSLQNLDNLVCQRGSTRGITINAIITSLEVSDSDQIASFWGKKGINVRLQECHSRGGNLQNTDLVTTSPRAVKKCGLFATHGFITWQGQVLACCHDLTGNTGLADLSVTTLREAARSKIRIIEEEMPFSICKNCDEPAADRPLPQRPFPDSIKARSRFLKSHCLQQTPVNDLKPGKYCDKV